MLARTLTVPWKRVVDHYRADSIPVYVAMDTQRSYWAYGWMLALAGIVGTGVFMPYLVLAWHIPVAYQNYIVVGGAFLGGLLWQLVSVFSVSITFTLIDRLLDILPDVLPVYLLVGLFILVSDFGAPAFSVYWYFAHFAPHHDLVRTDIVGATLLKVVIMFGIPLIKSFFTGQLFAVVLRWIRNERPPRPKGKPLPSDATLP